MEDIITSLPLIDTHMHRISPKREPDFGQIAGAVIPGIDQDVHTRQKLLYYMLIASMRERFGLPADASDDQVEAERNRRLQADPHHYYQSCFEGANVGMYCIETGAPLRSSALSEEENTFFDSCIPEENRSYVLRIERFIDDLLPLALPFDEFVRRFHDDLFEQSREPNVIALKSVIAYYGGLDILLPTCESARKAYELQIKGQQDACSEKVMYSYLLMIGAQVAEENGIPLQIHTGPGNGLYLDHTTFNPVCMSDFLRDKRILNRVRIVLLHCGHPYEEETGFLVSQYANVYTDLSQTLVFSSLMAEQKMRALFEYAPLDKISYGSDGVLFPELYWYAPKRMRTVLAKVLTQMQEEGYLTRARAEETARNIMYQNACNCYERLNNRLSVNRQ